MIKIRRGIQSLSWDVERKKPINKSLISNLTMTTERESLVYKIGWIIDTVSWEY